MTIKHSPSLYLLILAAAGAAGCGSSAASLKPAQLQKEATAQHQFKQQLSGMSSEQMAQTFRSDPQRARAMLMPPGMGNPMLRMNQARPPSNQGQN